MPKTPGRFILTVIGILMVIFSGIVLLIFLLALAGSTYVGNSDLATLIVVNIILAIINIIGGIMGIVQRKNLSKANILLVFGIVLIAARIVALIILGFSGFTDLIGLALPVLYVIGAYQNKNAAAVQRQPPM